MPLVTIVIGAALLQLLYFSMRVAGFGRNIMCWHPPPPATKPRPIFSTNNYLAI
jgi:hypothetical protein